MGVVAGIDANNFPAQSRDVGVKSLLETKHGKYPAVAVRRDRDEPNDVIWRIDGELLPLDMQFGPDQHAFVSQRTLDSYPDELFIRPRGKHCDEGKIMRLCFHYDLKNTCEAICVYDRGPFMVFLVQTGPHEGRYVSAHECQYSPKRDSVKQ